MVLSGLGRVVVWHYIFIGPYAIAENNEGRASKLRIRRPTCAVCAAFLRKELVHSGKCLWMILLKLVPLLQSRLLRKWLNPKSFMEEV